jgi:SpoVK/Ycf46/Vps4 family AAA+-type ATPase
MHPVVRSLSLSLSRTPLRYPSRRITNRRFPQPRRTFSRTCPQATSGDIDKSDGAVANEDGAAESEASRAEDDSEKDSSTALSIPPVKDLAHYGSAARRSKRSKAQTEVTPSVRIPEWFIDNNVRPVEENGRSPIALLTWSADRAEYVDPAERAQIDPNDAPGIIEPSAADENDASATDADPAGHVRYYVDFSQWNELVSTSRGLLRLTTPFVAEDVASRKNHLILHYAGEGGDYLLDELVQKLAMEMRADTVLLDALDIGDLACDPHNTNLSEDAADDRRLLSYDVYQRDEGYSSELRRAEEQAVESDEQEEQQDGIAGSIRPGGHTIFLDVRGSPLDLSNEQPWRGRRSQSHAGPPGSVLSNLGSFFAGKGTSEVARSKAAERRLAPLIEALLAGPFLKRTMRNGGQADVNPTKTSPPLRTVQVEPSLILQIRDIKILQQTAFGRKFLNVLYEQIQSRRRGGQRVMIVGTDTFPKAEQYSATNIRTLQSEPPGNISRTMVITPVIPSQDAGLTLRQDKQSRTRAINLRHLWQMLSIKLPGLYGTEQLLKKWASLSEDFSIDRFSAFHLHGVDRLWTFDQVHRLSTMIVGHLETDSTASVEDCVNQACKTLRASDNAKFGWTERQKVSRMKSKPDIERSSESQRLEKIRKKLSRYEKKLVGGVIEPEKITTTFDHVHAPLDTIEALKTLTTLSLVRPEAFKYGVLASDKIPGLLLYGPPGTGKTLLAKAVAKESGATVLEVSGAELNDMYVGEGEKNVKALFSLAKKLTPCVVFIDEADAVFSARGGGQRRVSHRELLNQFLREWDGMSNDSGSAFIMVATNRPFDLDDAVLRRLPRRLLVDLPSEADRLEILKIHLREEVLAKDVSLASIASRTPFYSGSDLKNLSVAAALNCVQEENEQAKKHSGDECFEHAETRTLTAAHFERALEDISASISEDMSSLKEIKKFDEQFGDKRGRKKKSPKWGFNRAAEADKVLDTIKVRN